MRPADPTVGEAPAPQPEVGGWHLVEWSAELLGTALMVFCGLGWITLDFNPHSPVATALDSTSARLALTGLLFPAAGSLYSLTPLGRRSGAHLNPAVTVAFWLRRHVHPHDLTGYVVAQLCGGVAGALLCRRLWGGALAAVDFGVTRPGRGLSSAQVTLVETGMVALLLLVIFAFVSDDRTARLTPFAVWVTIAVLVWQVAPYTGTSLNPARTLGSDAAAGSYPAFWAYVVGPVAGALVAGAVWSRLPQRTLTAKLFHDPRYRSTMRTALPALPA